MKGIAIYFDHSKKEIERVGFNKLNFRKEAINNKSIEIFNDEDPCIIHYTYCVNALALILFNTLSKEIGNNSALYPIKESMSLFKEYVVFPTGVEYVQVI